ncbi:uncharacterized protein LOC129716665 [Wyeomyia smithii]|uniref:uncharacterized protein LOC129716665 n=1 Tax=Wyeomyia smithii TaxID=174621 RepID=UPI002467FDE0|nr:uncharacterized protein LOC129716665 [Wyeomyia smithii]
MPSPCAEASMPNTRYIERKVSIPAASIKYRTSLDSCVVDKYNIMASEGLKNTSWESYPTYFKPASVIIPEPCVFKDPNDYEIWLGDIIINSPPRISGIKTVEIDDDDENEYNSQDLADLGITLLAAPLHRTAPFIVRSGTANENHLPGHSRRRTRRGKKRKADSQGQRQFTSKDNTIRKEITPTAVPLQRTTSFIIRSGTVNENQPPENSRRRARRGKKRRAVNQEHFTSKNNAIQKEITPEAVPLQRTTSFIIRSETVNENQPPRNSRHRTRRGKKRRAEKQEHYSSKDNTIQKEVDGTNKKRKMCPEGAGTGITPIAVPLQRTASFIIRSDTVNENQSSGDSRRRSKKLIGVAS